jgi:hypothetical protein
MRSIAAVLVGLLFCSSVFGQIELSYVTAKSLVGATSPRVVGERILIGDDSKPQISPVAIVKVQSSEKFRIKARKSLFEAVELIPLNENEFLLIGSGEYLVEAISLNHDRSLKVTVSGTDPTPDPKPDPKPDPPKPDVNVGNDYNVGLIAYKSAPSDPAIAKAMATSYRVNASRLFGQGSLADIATILNQIEKDFASKQCKDQATCLKWESWKTLVSSALKAEQTKRGTFSRQDWYSSLVEIAAALEAVK